MPRKIDLITELYKRTIKDITSDSVAWRAFLHSAAYQYKYPFADQVLIYAQRPYATACAETQLWNQHFGRWVKRGATGIALIDGRGDKNYLKYVFDVSDTHDRDNKPFDIWGIKPEYEGDISREEVINLCRTNLQYALTGDTKVLDAYAIENQIRTHQDEIDLLMEKEETTQGDPERYEKAIVGLYEKIGVLREQLRLAKEQAATNESIQSEIERFMKTIQEYSGDSFTEYDDTVVRRLVECIKVSADRTIEIILKGGIHGKEKV